MPRKLSVLLIIALVLTSIPINVLPKRFADADRIASYAKMSALLCVKNDIFTGGNNGELAPKESLTRAQGATVIMKLLSKAGLIG